MVVSINMTQIALQALRAGVLTARANRNRDVAGALHSMYAACFLYLFTMWKRRGCTILQFGELKKEIAKLSLKRPERLLGQLERWDATTGGGVSGARVDGNHDSAF